MFATNGLDSFLTCDNSMDANGAEHDSLGRFTGKQKKDLQRDGNNGKVKPSGANTFTVRGFCNEERRKYHVDKHLRKFSGMSEKEYVEEGIKLLEQPVTKGGVRGYMEPDGTIVRYDPERHWYACGKPKDGIWSLYIMSVSRFEGKRKQVLNHGGKT